MAFFGNFCYFLVLFYSFKYKKCIKYNGLGGVAEWLKAPVLKTGNGATRSGFESLPSAKKHRFL